MTAITRPQPSQSASTRTQDAMWLAVALSALIALSYIMMKLQWLGIGPIELAPQVVITIYIVTGGYLLGGALILLRNRRLWIAGAVINGLVMLLYFSMYAQHPEVLLSAGGAISKSLQLLLEVGLLYLIFTHGPNPQKR